MKLTFPVNISFRIVFGLRDINVCTIDSNNFGKSIAGFKSFPYSINSFSSRSFNNNGRQLNKSIYNTTCCICYSASVNINVNKHFQLNNSCRGLVSTHDIQRVTKSDYKIIIYILYYAYILITLYFCL